jgi:hypothetical protein
VIYDVPAIGSPTDSRDDFQAILAASGADRDFKDSVLAFLGTGSGDRIRMERHAPRIKVARLLTHLLASEPELAVTAVSINARSGCSDYAGQVRVDAEGGTRVFEFEWCCRWRAEEEGWQDYFGLPDQMRAAREYDWRCFRVWRERER